MAPLGILSASVACRDRQQATPEVSTLPTTPGAPPAFGTAPGAGPAVSSSTFAEAEKLAQVTMSAAERDMAAASWRRSMAPQLERRTGPRKVPLDSQIAPATRWNPVLADERPGPARDQFVRSKSDSSPLPSSDADIAFAPVTQLSRWIEGKALSSERLTNIYLQRIAQFDPKLRSVITLTKEVALQRAKQADAEIAAGRYRGPLHGIPYGVKDLLDTAGIATTYGAEPFKDRVPTADATVVNRLNEAGAVLIAKLSLGALALNDIWFGGQTMNPWLIEEGASGSSAGPGAATAAALVGFSIGSETGGSIVAPSMRCGVTGLRPTFGRVPRTGAMTLCWSLDKIGPMTRSVEDAMLVLQALTGPDSGDVSSVPSYLDFDSAAPVNGLRVGYFPAWMKENPSTDVDRAALEMVRKIGMTTMEVSLPDWPYGSLMPVLFSEAAAAFEELTLSGGTEHAEGAGARCVAQPVSPGALSFSGRFRPGRPIPASRRPGNGTSVLAGGPAARAVTARRNAHAVELHRSSVADAARRFRSRLRSAERLGTRPGEPAAAVLACPPRTTRRHFDRPAVRRRDGCPRGHGAGAGIWRGRRAAAVILDSCADPAA